MLPTITTYPSIVPVMLDPLQPATNYIVRTLAVYPNNESNRSSSITFTTDGIYLQSLCVVCKLTPLQMVCLELLKYHLLVSSYNGTNHQKMGSPLLALHLDLSQGTGYIPIVVHHVILWYASDDSPDDMFVLSNINLSLAMFTYDLSSNRRITPGVQTDISLSASNSVGSSSYSNSLPITIPVPSNTLVHMMD